MGDTHKVRSYNKANPTSIQRRFKYLNPKMTVADNSDTRLIVTGAHRQQGFVPLAHTEWRLARAYSATWGKEKKKKEYSTQT